MLRTQLGEDVFWRGMRTYGNENRYKSVETSDFRKVMERVSGRDLERFFYDWTERPGHPVLTVASTYLPDTKQVRVEVKQTQASEAFHFPLPIECHVPIKDITGTYSDGNHVKARTKVRYPATFDVTEKEQTFFANVDDRPDMVVIDPDLTVFCEMTEEKGRDVWLKQAQTAPTAAAHYSPRPISAKANGPRTKKLSRLP